MARAAPRHRPLRQIAPLHVVQHRPDVASRQARRALATNSAAWRRIRAQVLAHEPLCRACAERRVVRAANVVDHVDGDATNNRPDNLQPLCSPCHSRKTAADDGGFGNRKRGKGAEAPE